MGRDRTLVAGLTLVASIGIHVAVGATGALCVAYRALAERASAPSTVEPQLGAEPSPAATSIAIDLPALEQGTLLADRPPDPAGVPPAVHGGATIARLDTGAAGAGGDEAVPAPALNLSDDDDHLRLSPDLVSRLDRDQIQRLQIARDRASWEDRRATPHPQELTFLATGPGSLDERRPVAPNDPSRGALSSPSASLPGGELGAPLPDPGESEEARRARLGGAHAGGLLASPGVGVNEGHPGDDHRASAPVATGRPDVTPGPAAVPAAERARPKDDVDSDQEVATTVRSLVHASTAGGAQGEGRGGSGGGGDPGAGGAAGNGSHARPLGAGDGDVFDFWTSDPRLVGYFRSLHGRLDPLWADAFPRSAMYDLKQGTVILEFTVAADGSASVSWPPLRPSGIEEFDRNCASAIRRASPFPPIPRDLGRSFLRIRAPFTFNNPIVK